jgi:uncharacterized membrane protein
LYASFLLLLIDCDLNQSNSKNGLECVSAQALALLMLAVQAAGGSISVSRNIFVAQKLAEKLFIL